VWPKGGQWAKARLPFWPEWYPVVCGQWAKVRLPVGPVCSPLPVWGLPGWPVRGCGSRSGVPKGVAPFGHSSPLAREAPLPVV